MWDPICSLTGTQEERHEFAKSSTRQLKDVLQHKYSKAPVWFTNYIASCCHLKHSNCSTLYLTNTLNTLAQAEQLDHHIFTTYSFQETTRRFSHTRTYTQYLFEQHVHARSVHLCLTKPPQHIQSSEITPAPSVCPRTHACCTRQDMNISATLRHCAGRTALSCSRRKLKMKKRQINRAWL